MGSAGHGGEEGLGGSHGGVAGVRAEKGVEGDCVGSGDVGERGVRSGEVLALCVEIDECIGDGEAEREEPEADGDGVEGGAEREDAEQRGGVEREREGEVVGGDGQARHEEEQAERGARARLGEVADGSVHERADESGLGGRGLRAEEEGVQRGGRRRRVVGGERAPGDAGEGRQVSGPGRHGAHVGGEERRGICVFGGTGCWSHLHVLEFWTCGLGSSCDLAAGLRLQADFESDVNSAQTSALLLPS